ncbi:MAG: hypothetical protein ACKER6_00265 [Candidatus Hodgkinia cicadicola]
MFVCVWSEPIISLLNLCRQVVNSHERHMNHIAKQSCAQSLSALPILPFQIAIVLTFKLIFLLVYNLAFVFVSKLRGTAIGVNWRQYARLMKLNLNHHLKDGIWMTTTAACQSTKVSLFFGTSRK